MFARARSLAALASLVLVTSLAAAQAAPLDTTAANAVVMDANTGDILFAKAGDDPFDPSSMAKLMTLEVVFEALKDGSLKPSDTFKVSRYAWRMPSPKMFTREAANIAVQDLLQGIIVDSGNDASVVVAEGMSGSEGDFAERLNKRAKEIGLTKSHFSNATGLPDSGERMSARDIAVLARHIMISYPTYYRSFSQRDFTWEKIAQRNSLLYNGLASDIDGLKSGRIDKTYSAVVSAARDTRRFIVVVNGLPSDKDAMTAAQKLLSSSFKEYRSFELVAANQIVGLIPVFGGKSKDVGLTVDQPIDRLMNREMRAKMKVSLDYNAPLKAPVKAGTKVGTLTVQIPGTVPTTVPVMTVDPVLRAGVVAIMKTALTYIFFGDVGDLPPPSTMRKKHGTGAAANSGAKS